MPRFVLTSRYLLQRSDTANGCVSQPIATRKVAEVNLKDIVLSTVSERSVMHCHEGAAALRWFWLTIDTMR